MRRGVPCGTAAFLVASLAGNRAHLKNKHAAGVACPVGIPPCGRRHDRDALVYCPNHCSCTCCCWRWYRSDNSLLFVDLPTSTVTLNVQLPTPAGPYGIVVRVPSLLARSRPLSAWPRVIVHPVLPLAQQIHVDVGDGVPCGAGAVGGWCCEAHWWHVTALVVRVAMPWSLSSSRLRQRPSCGRVLPGCFMASCRVGCRDGGSLCACKRASVKRL